MKKILNLFIAIICLSLTLVLTSCGGDIFEKGYNEYKNISYNQHSTEVLNIYTPKKRESNELKAILFISGEEWTFEKVNGKDEDLCIEYAEKGYVAATMSYHDIGVYGNSEYTLWTILEDVEKAIAKLRTFVGEVGINITELTLHGRYSGAHIATMFAWAMPEKSEIPLKAVVALAGPMSFEEEYWSETKNYEKDDALKMACKLYGSYDLEGYLMKDGTVDVSVLTEEQKATVKELVSPLSYLTYESLPVIFAYAPKDKELSYKHSDLLKETLNSVCMTYKNIDYKNSGHSLALDPSVSEQIYAFMDEYMTAEVIERPAYVEPPHEHVFVEGKCECGEADPNYVPPHVHEACPECGLCVAEDCDGAEEVKCLGHTSEPETPEVHEHVFVEGKCECGAEETLEPETPIETPEGE